MKRAMTTKRAKVTATREAGDIEGKGGKGNGDSNNGGRQVEGDGESGKSNGNGHEEGNHKEEGDGKGGKSNGNGN
jgi:hypothetical protein